MADGQGELLVPGEKVSYEEEFSAGVNTYVDPSTGEVRAKVIGYAVRNWASRSASVKPLKSIKYLLDVGDVVHAIVTGFKDSVVVVSIFYNESKRMFIPSPLTGIILAARISSWRVKLHKEVFGYGDVIRAFVAEKGGPPFSLSTRGREYGVILAKCPVCSAPLVKRGPTLVCTNCKARVKRKVSSHYMRVRG